MSFILFAGKSSAQLTESAVIGAGDLMMDAGRNPQKMVELSHEVERIAAKHNITLMAPITDPSELPGRLARGYRFLIIIMDAWYLSMNVNKLIQASKQVVEEERQNASQGETQGK